jgi:hypothetical protein
MKIIEIIVLILATGIANVSNARGYCTSPCLVPPRRDPHLLKPLPTPLVAYFNPQFHNAITSSSSLVQERTEHTACSPPLSPPQLYDASTPQLTGQTKSRRLLPPHCTPPPPPSLFFLVNNVVLPPFFNSTMHHALLAMPVL